MNIRKHYSIVMTLLVIGLILSACAAPTPAPTQVPPTVAPTQAPTQVPPTQAPPTAAPTQAPPTAAPTQAPTQTPSALSRETKFGAAWQSVSCESLGVAPTMSKISDCGMVTVPEKRGENGAAVGDKTIQLGVVRVRSDKPNTPVVLGTGGPGGFGFSSIQKALEGQLSWLPDHAGILDDRDYVLFTQRGTKSSKPELNCPEYDIIEFQSALEGWSDQQVSDTITKALTACADKFKAAGVDLSAYNTNESAADIKDIAAALGYDKIIYYGQSYGTILGQFLMRNHPEILQAVILDGVAQVKNTSYAQMVNIQDSFTRVFDACKADTECNANYPDLQNTLQQVYDAYQKNPAPVIVALGNETATFKVNGEMLLTGMFGEMYGGAGVILPSQIYALKANDPLAIRAFAPSLPSPLNPSARIMHFAVNCADDPLTTDEPAMKDLAAMYERFARTDNRSEALACNVLKVPQLSDASDAAVKSELPVLILNGGFDPATPPSNGQVVGETLPNSQMVTFPSAGHVQDHNPCALQIMKAFMENPSAKVDTSCLPAKPVFNVPVKAEVKSEDGKATLSLTVPAGFAAAGDKQPNAWKINGGVQSFAVRTFPAGTSALDALTTQIKTLPVDLSKEKVEDVTIDGNPAKVMKAAFELQGLQIAVNAYAIQVKNGTFVLTWLNQAGVTETDYQQSVVVPILSSIKISQ